MRLLRSRIAFSCLPIVVLLLMSANDAAAQRAAAPSVQSRQFRPAVLPDLEGVPDWLEEYEFEQEEFTFVRIQYDSDSNGRFWMTDYPDADINLAGQLGRLTSLDVSPEPQVLRLTDVSPADHPMIYVTEPERMRLSDEEVAVLRAYLTHGGFLMMDDFWGEEAWETVEDELVRVIPDRIPTELPLEHPIFHCVFDLKEKPQVPSIHVALSGRDRGITWERAGGREPHYRAILNDDRRIMVLLCHNTDLADGWERAGEHEWYTAEFSVKRALPMGINAIFYALTE